MKYTYFCQQIKIMGTELSDENKGNMFLQCLKKPDISILVSDIFPLGFENSNNALLRLIATEAQALLILYELDQQKNK